MGIGGSIHQPARGRTEGGRPVGLNGDRVAVDGRAARATCRACASRESIIQFSVPVPAQGWQGREDHDAVAFAIAVRVDPQQTAYPGKAADCWLIP